MAGLGNPGNSYADTRHNIGFMVLDRITVRAAAPGWRREGQTFAVETRWGGQAVFLVKPQTYMNRSGTALRELFAEGRFALSRLVVVHDDLDLPFGELRIRTEGGHGGHNGIRSLLAELETTAFTRIKCGIGRPPPGMETADYVLSAFSPEERAALPGLLDTAADALAVLLSDGPAEAMLRYHTKK